MGTATNKGTGSAVAIGIYSAIAIYLGWVLFWWGFGGWKTEGLVLGVWTGLLVAPVLGYLVSVLSRLMPVLIVYVRDCVSNPRAAISGSGPLIIIAALLGAVGYMFMDRPPEVPRYVPTPSSAPFPSNGYKELNANINEGDVLYLRSDKSRIGRIVKVESDHSFDDGSTRDAIFLDNGSWVPRETAKMLYVKK